MKQSLISYTLFNLADEEIKYNECKKRWMLMKYHKKKYDKLVVGYEIEKSNLQLAHEEMKYVYSSLAQNEFIQTPRNILQFVGSIHLSNISLNILNDLIKILIGNCGHMIVYHLFIEKCTAFHSICLKIWKIDFKIKNRLIILNNYGNQ